MDIEKLIEQLNDWNEKYISNLCGDRTIKCEEYCIKDDCLIVKAATALSTLQAENAQLRESRDHWKRLAHELSEGVNGKDADHERLQAENEKLRNEVERQRRSADDRKHLHENAERAYMKVVAELEQVKAERDAAIDCCSGYCATCRFVKDCAKHDMNDAAPIRWYYGDCEDWEWCGQKED